MVAELRKTSNIEIKDLNRLREKKSGERQRQ